MAHAMPQVSGVDHRWVRVGEMNFHVAEAGEGDPILLVHGWPQHWYAWRHVIPRLAESNRVIAIDLRGFGWTDIAWTGFEKEAMADDIANLLAELELERVTYVGHDWGAWLGYLLAMRRPGLIEWLVAMSAPPPFSRGGLRSLAAAPRLRYQLTLAAPTAVKMLSNPRYVAHTVKAWSKQRENLPAEVRKLYGRDLKASTRARATMLLYRRFVTRELPAVLAGRYRGERIAAPTLILYGEKDPILRPSLYEGHERHFDDLRTEQVPRAGHFLPEEAPELVADRILEPARDDRAAAGVGG
jgi:pimeloyl-ACP methyl ester carboxylesterase